MGTSELWVKMAWHLQHVKTHSVLHKVEQWPGYKLQSHSDCAVLQLILAVKDLNVWL
jgi:hypothetical protein